MPPTALVSMHPWMLEVLANVGECLDLRDAIYAQGAGATLLELAKVLQLRGRLPANCSC